MSATALTDRLRALADFIDTHNLPEPALSISSADYGTANFDTHEELCEWAEALGAEVDVQRFVRPDRTYDYYTFGTAVYVGQQRLFFAYSQDVATADCLDCISGVCDPCNARNVAASPEVFA